jgi:hypothetical protein
MRGLLINVRRVLADAREVVRYVLIFLWGIFCPKAALTARLLAAESQLAACKHEIAANKHSRPRFTPGFRLLWVVLSKCLDRWEDLAHLMQPATVEKWHTRALQDFWRWKSCRKGGRPPISGQMQSLIYQLSKENSLWNPERLHDTLILLRYDPPCADTIRKYMYRPRNPRKDQRPGCRFCVTTWTYPGPSISSRSRRSASPRCMCSSSSTTAAARLYVLP